MRGQGHQAQAKPACRWDPPRGGSVSTQQGHGLTQASAASLLLSLPGRPGWPHWSLGVHRPPPPRTLLLSPPPTVAGPSLSSEACPGGTRDRAPGRRRSRLSGPGRSVGLEPVQGLSRCVMRDGAGGLCAPLWETITPQVALLRGWARARESVCRDSSARRPASGEDGTGLAGPGRPAEGTELVQ